ncbi:MAG: ABC transporter ATP-binding protein [Ruminococcus sp.]|nr:ABC transporter ATP-binding protein [Ruminococcus sp.]
MITCRNVTKRFRNGNTETTVINDVSLHIEKGEFVALTGKSGSGKSTLLNMIGLIEVPDSGTIDIAGSDTGRMTDIQRAEIRNHKLGYIFQSFYLEERYNVFRNIEMPLLISDVPKAERKKRISECMEYVDISEKSGQPAETLSGGEKQRVCIARALANDPDIILADEPCGNLDSVNTERVMELLRKLSDAGKTILMVTHSMEDAQYADRIITLRDGVITDEDRK